MRFKDPDGAFPRFRNYIVFDFGAMVKNNDLINPLARWASLLSLRCRRRIGGLQGQDDAPGSL